MLIMLYFIRRSKMSSSLSQPSGVTASKPAVVTESITKTTFTETTVKRVTAAAVIEQVTSTPSRSRSECLLTVIIMVRWP